MTILNLYKRTLIALLILGSIATPYGARAAVIHADAMGGTVGVHKQLVVRVSLTTDEASINAVSGKVRIPAGIHIDGIDTAGSAFTLWIQNPKLILSDSAIEFSGGVPHGVPPKSDVLLFTIRAHADTSGTYTFTPQDVVAYKNDGLGTTETTSTNDATVVVDTSLTEQTPSRVSAQTPLVADIGRDDALFDGKYFVAFYGGDTGSGVAHYEVKEGWLGTSEKVERFYVIKDQSLKTRIVVRAVGTDGAVVSTEVSGLQTDTKTTVAMGLLVALVLAVLIALRRKIIPHIIRR